MAENIQSTVIYTSRNLNIMPFRPPENQLNVSKDREDWLEEIEREFRYFKITTPMDKRDAIIIYGGKNIARLARSLPEPEDPRGKLDDYSKLRKKLNEYFIPKKNKYYARYIFLKMRPQKAESTISYATRLREKSRDCDFGINCDERILEQLIQTTENSMLVQKCISKSWTLQEFLTEARQTEEISCQMQDMKTHQRRNEAHKVHIEEQQNKTWIPRNVELCSYCGLRNAHPKGMNCPAYGGQCKLCNKVDHFASVCRTDIRRKYSKSHLPNRQLERKIGPCRIQRAEEEHTDRDSCSDDDFHYKQANKYS